LSQGFPRQARITKTDDFSSVFSLRKRISGRYLVIHYRAGQSAGARLGLVVSRKIAKRSVDRNYMKRVLRELFRRRRSRISPMDLVVRVTKAYGYVDFAEVEREFSELLVRLERRIAANHENDATHADA
jgi:ribonuclease P protein component